jgi:hypothetical protein
MSSGSVIGVETTSDVDLPSYPMSRAPGCPFDPPPELTEDRRNVRKVRLWDGRWVWLFCDYHDVRSLHADPRISHDSSNPSYPHETPAFRARAVQAKSFVNMDDPEHARLRMMVSATFTPRRLEVMRPQIQERIDQLIDTMLSGGDSADLHRDFALPLTTHMICILLGVSEDQTPVFERVTDLILSDGTPAEQVQQAQGELLAYLENLVTDKQADPREDVMSDLAQRYVATGQTTAAEAAITARLLLTAGHDTTSSMIALGALALLEHPDQLDVLRCTEDPKLLESAVEELLRYLTIAHKGPRRFALEDIEIAGVTIRAGDGIALSLDLANWDPAVFAEPERLDISRKAPRHIAFGFGPHQCLGQSLARLELRLVLGTLFRRIPTLRLAVELEEIDFKDDALIYGVRSLPVTW